MTQPRTQPHEQQPAPADLVARYAASGQAPDGPLGTALFHHRAQPEVRRELLRFLAPDTSPATRAAALAWIGRYQGGRSIQARQLLRSGLTDSDADVRLVALQYVGQALAGRPDAGSITEREILPHTRPHGEPSWRLRLAAWSALSAALRCDPLPRFRADGGDPEPRVVEGVRLLSQIWAARSTSDANTVGILIARWEQLLTVSEPG
ncbi:MAG: HEAT repeat domain-containing protein [Chloroflexi bacterium]|nr:HEAT repeat domain-containing protein [Chloroflexota bacterium]